MDNPNETTTENTSPDTTEQNNDVTVDMQGNEPGGEVVEQGNAADTGSVEGEGNGDPAGSEEAEEHLLFNGEVLPDFIPPEETEREKALRLELEELKQRTGDKQGQRNSPDVEPKEPVRDDFFSDEEYKVALRQYFTDHDSWKAGETKKAQATENHRAQFKEAVGVYVEKRGTAAAKLKDFDRYEKHADNNLEPGIVGAILFGGKNGTFDNTAEMMYAIGRSPDLLKQLNETTNPFLAGAMLLDISKKARFAPAAPKKPVNAIPEVEGGNLKSLTADLQQAEEEAERTGDRTRVIELQGQIRNAKK